MKRAALTLAMLLLAGSAAQAFDGNDRILEVDQYQKLPPNSPYDAPGAFGYVVEAPGVDYVPYGSQVTRTEYGVGPPTGYVAEPTYLAPRTYGYVAQPTTGCVAEPTYGYGAQPSYGYVAQPAHGYVETRTYGYAVPPTVYEPRRYYRQGRAGAPAPR